MNAGLLKALRYITAHYGADILNDGRRVNALLADLAKDEPKPAKRALLAGLEAGFHHILGNADASGRTEAIAGLARRLHREEGYDLALCTDTLELLSLALSGDEHTEPATAPHCAACGKELQEAWNVCPYCGVARGAAESPSPATPQTATPPVTPQRVEMPPPANMVRIPGGTFTMGSPAHEAGRFPNEVRHQVTVHTFYMGKYEVTQKEWQEVMGDNPSFFKGDNLPVEQVSWYDAVEYCNRRSEYEELTPAYTINTTRKDPQNSNEDEYDELRWLVTWDRNANGCRLPTEAEWEYACRAGTTTPFSTGSNITTSQANYDGNYPYNNNAKGMYRERTVEIGSFAANGWGLYNMHGNVWEWCWDWYGNYPNGAQSDPVGPSTGADRVLRGGSWVDDARYLRSASRGNGPPSNRGRKVGFRVVRNAE